MKNGAIFISVILNQVLGFFWYSDFLFSEIWLKGIGKTADQLDQSNPVPFVFAIVGAFVLGYGMNWVFKHFHVKTHLEGIKVSTILWLCFCAFSLAIHYKFIGYSVSLIALESAKELASFYVVSLMLTTKYV